MRHFSRSVSSQELVSAWDNDTLVGIGNATSDGFLVVYYPHLLVRPDYQGQGIGQQIIEILKQRYEEMQMQMLVADGETIGFRLLPEVWIHEGESNSAHVEL